MPEGQQVVISAERRSKLAAVVAKAAELKQVAADKAAASAVANQVGALPANLDDLQLSDRGRVEAARAAYDALTEAQLTYLPDGVLGKIEAAEGRIAVLQKQADDEAAADDVVAVIGELPSEGSLTLANAHDVASARLAYDALTDDQKGLFAAGAREAALERLAALEAKLAVLQQELDEVTAALTALPARAAVTTAVRSAVAGARVSYDALPDESKSLVGAALVKRLTDAEARLAELDDKAAADVVIRQIDALPSVAELVAANEGIVQAARATYSELTGNQKELVVNFSKLEAAEARIAQLKDAGDPTASASDEDRAAAQAVGGIIEAIGAVESDDEATRVRIKEAREAYEALTPDQKALVDVSQLAAAEAAISEIEKHRVRDAVDALGDVSRLTDADTPRVRAARSAFDALTAKQQGELSDAREVIEAAEAVVAEFADEAAAALVREKIAALPARAGLRVGHRVAVQAARAAYDALTAKQKARVANYAWLTSTERRLAEIVNLGNATVSGVVGKVYTGAAITQAPTVKDAAGVALRAGVDYRLSYSSNINAGTATMTVVGMGAYAGSKPVRFAIAKAANTMKVKTAKKKVKASALKKKAQKVKKAIMASKAKGAVTYARVAKGSSKCLSVNKKSGVITVKKGTKKGAYKLKVKVRAAGTSNYNALVKTVTVKIVVKG